VSKLTIQYGPKGISFKLIDDEGNAEVTTFSPEYLLELFESSDIEPVKVKAKPKPKKPKPTKKKTSKVTR